jgi:large subunit ribosomal protein L4
MTIDVYNLKNEKVGRTELPDSVFGVPWKPALVKQVVEAQLANRRRPWAHAKTRAEVRGGGRKPWRQKGTGRARHGSIRSPLWKGGGKAHGPLKDRDYSQKINKKMNKAAIFSVLSKKLKDDEVKILDSLRMESPKTKGIFNNLKNFIKPNKKSKNLDALLIPELENKMVYRAAANLPKTKILAPQSLNVYDLVNHKHIFVAQDAVKIIAEHYKIKR